MNHKTGLFNSHEFTIETHLDLPQLQEYIQKTINAALIVHVPKKIDYDAELEELGFEEHRTIRGVRSYYRWFGPEKDRYPPSSTAREGAGCLLVSPDEKHVLLVKENGCPSWKVLTGNGATGEDPIQTVKRESVEEVGIPVDETIPPVYLGWMHEKSAVFGYYNNVYHCFRMRSKEMIEPVVDKFELEGAKWFSIEELLQLDTKLEEGFNRPLFTASVAYKDMRISRMTLLMLRSKGLTVESLGNVVMCY